MYLPLIIKMFLKKRSQFLRYEQRKNLQRDLVYIFSECNKNIGARTSTFHTKLKNKLFFDDLLEYSTCAYGSARAPKFIWNHKVHAILYILHILDVFILYHLNLLLYSGFKRGTFRVKKSRTALKKRSLF